MQPAAVIQLSSLPAGRLIWTLTQIDQRAHAPQLSWVRPVIQPLLLQARETLRLERAWKASRAIRVGTKPVAVVVDPKVDQALGALYKSAQNLLQTLPGSAIADAAQLVLSTYFPLGLADVIRQPMIDELADAEAIALGLRTTHAAQAALLSFEPLLAHLESLLPEYALALAQPNQRAVEFSQLAAARAADHRGLCLLAARLLVRAEDHPAERPALDTLWAELEASQEAVRALRAARRPVTDLNPDTGEPLDLT